MTRFCVWYDSHHIYRHNSGSTALVQSQKFILSCSCSLAHITQMHMIGMARLTSHAKTWPFVTCTCRFQHFTLLLFLLTLARTHKHAQRTKHKKHTRVHAHTHTIYILYPQLFEQILNKLNRMMQNSILIKLRTIPCTVRKNQKSVFGSDQTFLCFFSDATVGMHWSIRKSQYAYLALLTARSF